MKILIVFILCQALSYGSVIPESKDGRIVGGNAIPITGAPYQVALLDRGGSQFCGGWKALLALKFIFQ